MAWDTFKAQSIRSQQQNRNSIPAVLRKMFVQQLIAENAARCGSGQQPLFKSFINPRYADTAFSFADWLTSMLPSLASWYRAFTQGADIQMTDETNAPDPDTAADNEDHDLLMLLLRYKRFMNEHSLFEPAWERPPFYSDGHEYIVFFPQILADFSEYEQLLRSAGHVRLIDVPLEQTQTVTVHQFQNSRYELTALIAHVQDLHEEGMEWQDITISIPEPDTYGPYLEQELALHAIPSVTRVGQPLSGYAAGRFFTLASQCVHQQFSFDSLKTLFLDKHLPWKDRDVIDQLMDFGRQNNCLCSWKENGKTADVWIQAFSSAAGKTEERAFTFYRKLTAQLSAMVTADSFSRLRSEYWQFRNTFFDMEQCSILTDSVFARCIAELITLADVADSFDIKLNDPYTFYLEHLAKKQYMPQQQKTGVNLVAYRNAAAACTGAHCVVDASQHSMTVMLRQMPFLQQNKRTQLRLCDTDISQYFAALYQINSIQTDSAYFSCADQGYSGYTIPYSKFAPVDGNKDIEDIEEGIKKGIIDAPYTQEQNWYLHNEEPFPQKLYRIQKDGFLRWIKKDISTPAATISIPPKQYNLLHSLLEQSQYGEYNGQRLLRVSATALTSFFTCPVRWAYKSILHLDKSSYDAQLISENVTGLIYHKALHHFFDTVKQKTKTIQQLHKGRLPQEYEELINTAVSTVLDTIDVTHHIDDKQLSVISADLILAKRESFKNTLKNTLTAFISKFARCAVEATEQTYTAPPPTDNAAFYYTGKIDLVLQTENDEHIIIDFKTGDPPKKKICIYNPDDNTSLSDYQIALYTYLYEYTQNNKNQASQPIHISKALFWSITQQKAAAVIGGGKKSSREDFELTIEQLHAQATVFAVAIHTHRLSAQNTDFSSCLSCSYRHICRTTYVVSGRRRNEIQL